MTSLSETLPMSAHRASVTRYLEGIEISFNSVAGRIITERLPVRCARDPVRPSLLLWACAANGGDTADALPVAAAFDLFDRFMLLHDELADVSAEPIARWGLGQSLNAGDALYALGFRMLASHVGNPERRLEAARIAGEAVLEAIEGRETAMEGRCALTGAALQAGAIIGGASGDVALAFARAGRALGMASEATETAGALRFAQQSLTLLEPHTRKEDLDAFAEVALYVARRAA
ncbi:MAG: polyprenyl synthetase family protein [Candidatus Cybelea sp.]